MRVRPITPDTLVEELADRVAGTAPGTWMRVAVDGPTVAEPGWWAAALTGAVRLRGRAARHVRAEDFLRPASLRFEQGRTNPDSFYWGWLDEVGLRREVLDPLSPGGTGAILPTLWDTRTDRATRAAYTRLPPGGVLILSGPLLLGGALPIDLAIHLWLSPAALARRMSADLRWTLPAYERYAREVAPDTFAEVVIRLDDPRRPALVERD